MPTTRSRHGRSPGRAAEPSHAPVSENRLELRVAGLRTFEIDRDDRIRRRIRAPRAQVGDRPDLAAPYVRLEPRRHARDLEVDRQPDALAPHALGPAQLCARLRAGERDV